MLRTNLSDWTSENLWRTELSIRPIWHQRTDRVLAHILVCFLAYVLWKTLEQWQSRTGQRGRGAMMISSSSSQR